MGWDARISVTSVPGREGELVLAAESALGAATQSDATAGSDFLVMTTTGQDGVKLASRLIYVGELHGEHDTFQWDVNQAAPAGTWETLRPVIEGLMNDAAVGEVFYYPETVYEDPRDLPDGHPDRVFWQVTPARLAELDHAWATRGTTPRPRRQSTLKLLLGRRATVDPGVTGRVQG